MTIQQLLLGGGAGEQTKYVDDYYNYFSYMGDGQQNRVLETGIDLSSDGGMVMFHPEGRLSNISYNNWGSQRTLSCADTVTGSSGAWRQWSNSEHSASSSSAGLVSNFGNGTITICDRTPGFSGNDLSNMVQCCNPSTWCNTSNRKSGRNTGSAKVHCFVFRQLVGYFKIVTWTGTGGSRAIAHGLEAEPGLVWIWGGTGFRCWSWGDTSGPCPSYPGWMDKDGTGSPSNPFYSYGDSTNIYVNSGWNYSNQTFVAYVWARATSNSKIHGDDENECFTFQCGARRSGWTQDGVSGRKPKVNNMYGQPGGIASHVMQIQMRPSNNWSDNNAPKMYDYMVPGRPMASGFNMQTYGGGGSARFAYMAGNSTSYINGGYGQWFGCDLSIGGVSAFGSIHWPDVSGHGCFYGHNNSDGSSYKDVFYTFRYPNMKPPKHGSDIFNASWYMGNHYRGQNPIFQGNARADFVINSSETSYQSSRNYTKHVNCRANGWTQVGSNNYLTLDKDGYARYAGYTGYTGSNDCTWLKGWGGEGATQMEWNSNYARFSWGFKDCLKTCHHFDRQFPTTGTYNHSLRAVPSMMIVKQQKNADGGRQTSDMDTFWCVYHKDMNEGSNPQNYGMYLNTNISKQQSSGFWNNTAPTATTLGVGNKVVDTTWNSDPYNSTLFMMFADTPGILKTGKYTGNGSFVSVDCGFTNGVRFVLVKREDWSGHWYVFDHAHGLGGGQYIDEAVFNTTGSHNWTCPSGVTSVCAVCVGGGGGNGRSTQDGNSWKMAGGGGGGLGWKNNISVTPGQTYSIYVGKHGIENSTSGEDSYFINTSTVKGGGGGSGSGSTAGTGGTYTGDGGGNGGDGSSPRSASNNGGYTYTSSGGAGGAGGYTGDGGDGTNDYLTGWPDYTSTNGSGGGGAGQVCGGGGDSAQVAGGVGLYGLGESGYNAYTKGNGATNNLTNSSNSDAQLISNPLGGSLPPGFTSNGSGYSSEITSNLYSFGAGLQNAGSTAGAKTNGANGGVRLVWSTNASETVAFPSTNVGCARPPYQLMNDAHMAPIYNQRWLCSLPAGFGVHDNSNLNANGGKYIYLAISGADNAWKKR